MSVDYEPLDLNELQSEYEGMSSQKGGTQEDFYEKFVRLPSGEGFVNMRFMPRKKDGSLYVLTRLHTLNDPTQKDAYGKMKKRSYHCPKEPYFVERNGKKERRWQGDCIICKYYNDLWQKSNSETDEKTQENLRNQARAIRPVDRYYFNVIVRAEKDKDGTLQKNVGPKVYSCGKTVYQNKIMRAMTGDALAGKKALGDITHPVSGRDFRLVKKIVKGASGEYPNYDDSEFEDSSPVGTPDEFKKWMEGLIDLNSLRVVKSDEELRHALKVHLGMVKSTYQAAEEDHSLDEFRGVTPVVEESKPQQELVINKPKSEPAKESSPAAANAADYGYSAEDEILADDDFMNELNSL